MANPVTWFEIYVNDMDRAKAFYTTVFGQTLTKINNPELDMWAFDMNDQGRGASGSLVKMEGCGAGGNSTMVYFKCLDCADEAEKAAKAGGRVMKPKTSIGEYGYIALVTDSEGNMIGLHSMV